MRQLLEREIRYRLQIPFAESFPNEQVEEVRCHVVVGVGDGVSPDEKISDAFDRLIVIAKENPLLNRSRIYDVDATFQGLDNGNRVAIAARFWVNVTQ